MIDFRLITESTDKYNFHSHTQFCDGHASMATMVDAALAAGFRHWGFSPHSPICVESPCNMKPADVSSYLDEVNRLRKINGSAISLYAGMEIDYLSPDWGPAIKYFQEIPLDYRIGSVHFVRSKDGEDVDIDGNFESFRKKMDRHFRNDIRYVVDRFFDNSLEMVSRGGFDIIGHFDKIGHNASLYQPGIEEEPWYESRVCELIDAIAAAGIYAEINTKARSKHNRFFPSTVYWQRIIDAGIPILVNSDAHHPDLTDQSRPEAFEILSKL
ncbi:MAG: histidinol-phosphatase [Paramuribaculum sp.]|nr:histidinol-phosphatase [Paramuribaculum sp.]MDE6487819.1 histidinol-phosphatase [Paramuribaculum sp.]